ncbi:amino acid ABC transporter substrate-binding protein [Chitinimonas arctica]|uniref:Amino acid ABC transporter substrate-binding protein n=1 Tax=Chitinimonas arctica TaxID=2594795 RepID=A0A516SGS4_9NEIS|nr:transporter substrate-binding domain-containing protein [Chitinimonas arctica]QDQ27332.1 amino acid ABC transporter substrate-binding protein [Chitinimonas arctica]
MPAWAICCWALLALGVQAEVLRVGFGTNKPPYIFEVEKRGLEYEIIEQAAAQADFQIEPFFAPMERLHRMLELGQLDAISTTNEHSGVRAFYSKPYIEYHNVAVALAARNLDIRSIADLGRYSVSAFQRARKLLGAEFQAMADKNPHYREEAQQVVRNRLLYARRIDVVVGDRRIIEYFNQELLKTGGVADARQPVTWYPVFPATPYQLGFRQEALRDRFNVGLDTLRRSGDYSALEKKYAVY